MPPSMNGYRPATLSALVDLLTSVDSRTDRDDLARLAFPAWQPRGRGMRLREPLRARVLRPYLREHVYEPQAIWWAIQVMEHEPLQVHGHHDRVGGHAIVGAITYALTLTGEPRWWRMLLSHRLRPHDDFPLWCREQGRSHWVANRCTAGHRHYYYQP